jgi:predicted extracellular nuclease
MNHRSFRVGTFNLRNLALPNQDFYHERYTVEEYNKKRLWTAEQLNRMQADVVGFQEVFHQQALRELLSTSLFCRNFASVVALPITDTPAVALASRFPIIDYKVIREFPAAARLQMEGAELPFTHFSRPVLSVRLRLNDQVECSVFVVHLKSKRPIVSRGADHEDPIERAKGQARALMLRTAEAIALRLILMEVLQNREHPVIVMGDMNDSGLSVTSQIVSGEVPFRNLEPAKKQKMWDVLLYHAKDIQARQSYGDFYYTHIHNGYYDSLDHIMVSQEFVEQNPNHVGRVVYASVLNDHLLDETLSPEAIPRWQSDHGQVVVSIELERDSRLKKIQQRLNAGD